MEPDERTLRADVESGRFQCQIDEKWGDPRIDWPYLYLWVKARPTESGIERYWLRVNCIGYPLRAPTGTFWDMDSNAQLSDDKRPWGIEEVKLAFRPDWPDEAHGGKGSAFYMFYDGVAISTHVDWPRTNPGRLWSQDKTIVDYLNEITRLLDSSDYTGPRGAQA